MKTSLPPRLSALGFTLRAACALAASLAASLHASSWLGGNANWSSNIATNPGWNGAGVPNAIGAIANHAGSTTTTTTQNVSAGVTVGTISLTNNSNNSWSITLTKGITLNQDGAGSGRATILNSNTSATAGNALVFSVGSLVLADDLLISNTGNSTNLSGAIQIGSTISGSGKVTFSNASTGLSQTGSIRLTGSNSFTGSVLIQKGTVTYNQPNSFGNSSNVITLGQSGQGKAALLSTTGVNVTQDITVASGAGDTLTLGALGTEAGTYNGKLTLNGDVTITSAVTNASGLAFATITGAGGITKAGTGIAKLTGANTYAGTTTVTAGTLTLGNRVSLYDGATGSWTATNLIVANGATLALSVGDANGFTAADVARIAGLGTVGGGFQSGSSIGFDTTEGNFEYAGSLGNPNGGANALGLIKLGANTLTLSGTNTYTGGTTISSGTLQVGAGGTAGLVAGNIVDNAALAFNRSDALTYAGAISGTGSLTQSGAGTLTLSAANTYTGGTTISAGHLVVDGSIAASSLTTVASGATLSGHGTVGALTIASGGILSPGNSPGTLTAGNTIFEGGGKFVFQVNDVTGTRGTSYDLLSISGGLTLTATSANPFILDLTSLKLLDNTAGLAANFDPATGYALTFLTTTTGIAGFDAAAFSVVTGHFLNDFGGTWSVALSNDDRDLTLTYTGASAVPEPATSAALLGLCVLGLAAWRQKWIRRR